MYWASIGTVDLMTFAKFEVLPYSRKLSRVKTFANFAVLPASAKVLSANFSARD